MLNQRFALAEENASLETFVIDPNISSKQTKKRPAMIVCPGGAYVKLAHRESEPIALHYNSEGFHSFILRYPVDNEQAQYPYPVLSLFQALALINKHAEEWFVDVSKIYVMGFSAGGHVAGLYANLWNNQELIEQAGFVRDDLPKVKGVILAYPLVKTAARPSSDWADERRLFQCLYGSETPSQDQIAAVTLSNLINDETLPQFIWCAADDPVLNTADTIKYVLKLQEQKLSIEFHMFKNGEHGLALGDYATANPGEGDVFHPLSLWPRLARNWMREL